MASKIVLRRILSVARQGPQCVPATLGLAQYVALLDGRAAETAESDSFRIENHYSYWSGVHCK